MSDVSAQLAALRALRATVTDPAQGAALDALIASLEQATGVRSHTQHIAGYATIAAAIAGDVDTINLYIVGERAQSARQLLAGYLRWLASQCGQLPLRGVREQKTVTDLLNIGLDQVYMQLATTVLVEREVFEGSALKQFDAKAYLAQYVGELLLPSQQRVYLQRLRTANEELHAVMAVLKARERRWPRSRVAAQAEPNAITTTALETLTSEILADIAKSAPWLRLAGPSSSPKPLPPAHAWCC